MMTISEIIEFYKAERRVHGDVEVHTEVNDGRSTYVTPYTPTRIVQAGKKEWPASRAGKYFVREY